MSLIVAKRTPPTRPKSIRTIAGDREYRRYNIRYQRLSSGPRFPQFENSIATSSTSLPKATLSLTLSIRQSVSFRNKSASRTRPESGTTVVLSEPVLICSSISSILAARRTSPYCRGIRSRSKVRHSSEASGVEHRERAPLPLGPVCSPECAR